MDMTQFVADKFNPETDEDRPQIGEKIEMPDGVFEIKKVDFITVSDIIKKGENYEPDAEGFDKVLGKPHKSRPAVIWLVWCNKIT